MTKTIRATLMTVLFSFVLVTGLQAQDKYDFAIVMTGGNQEKIFVSYNNAAYEQISVEQKNEYKGPLNYKALLEFVSSLTEKGWEIINVGVHINGYITYYLKKKK